MSLNLFNIHNIALVESCDSWAPSSPEASLSSIWESTFVDARTWLTGAIAQNGLMSVNYNTIFQREYKGASPESLHISTDFGQNWTECNRPFDPVLDTLFASYAGSWQPVSIFQSFRFINGQLFLNFMYQTGPGSVVRTTDGVTWDPVHSIGASPGYAPDSNTSSRYVSGTAYHINATPDNQVILAGFINQFNSLGYQIGNGLLALGSGNGPAPNTKFVYMDASGPVKYPTQSTQVARTQDGWTYHIAGDGELVWSTRDGDGSFAITGVFWNGSVWEATWTGSWRALEDGGFVGLNGFYSNPNVKGGGWATDGTTIIMPKVGSATPGDANEGEYVSMVGTVDTTLDYNADIVKGDPPNETSIYGFAVVYVPSARKWVMLYSFLDGSASPTYFYMKVSTFHTPGTFSDAIKVNLPEDYILDFAIVNSFGGMVVDYSPSNTSWVISTCIFDPSGNERRQLTATVPDLFVCND